MTSPLPGSARGSALAPRVRALFISDIHLGTRAAQAEPLLDFLRHCEADTIYLVGDIVDFWKVRRGPHWPQTHNDVVQKLLRRARKGTRVVLIPGNHDEGLRDYAGLRFGGIEIRTDIVHETAKGRRYLVMHGDEFDIVVRTARWLAYLGDHGYEFALWLNQPLNWVRRHLGLGFWSLSAYLKYRVKGAVAFIGAFEEAVATEARRRGVNGVICGHIHHASDRAFGGIHYLNCGDWVESCTAIVETYDGELRLVAWGNRSLNGRAGAAPEAVAPMLLPTHPIQAAHAHAALRKMSLSCHRRATRLGRARTILGVNS
jgi:UDP-2,3-diacylglucosamine pyrophosphatase LpxH